MLTYDNDYIHTVNACVFDSSGMHCEYYDVELWYQSNTVGILLVVALMWSLMALSVANSVFHRCDNGNYSTSGKATSSSHRDGLGSNYIYRRGVLVL